MQTASKDVTVIGIDKVRYKVTLTPARTIGNRKEPSAILVDGTLIGYLASRTNKRSTPRVYLLPWRAIYEAIITTSDGNVTRVYSSSICYLKRYWNRDGKIRHQFTIGLAKRGNIGHLRLTYNQALKLKVGQVVRKAQPLKLDLRSRLLTNGGISIPLKRPKGKQEWSLWPQIECLKAIDAKNWHLMLLSLHGKVVHEIVIEKLRRDMETTKVLRTLRKQRDEVLKALRLGQFYDGRQAMGVSIGKKFIFTIYPDLHIVDSPEYGVGLYIFKDYADAEAWATGTIIFQEARERAIAFIPHSEGWTDKLRLYIQK